MALIIPEIILLQTFKNVLKFIRTDYNNSVSAGDITKSMLYRLLSGDEIQRYKMFDQSISVLITKEDNPRHLDINLFFNAKRAPIPTMHIMVPSESQKDNAMSMSEGFKAPIFDETVGEYRKVYNRRFTARYNLVITSDNLNEVILLYHFFRSILISISPHLSLSGLENVKQNGGDIQIDPSIVPINIHSRAIGVEFDYDVEGQEFLPNEIFIYDPDVNWIGTPEVSSNGI